MTHTYQLIDVWRFLHPTALQYTYHHSHGASRLNHIYVPRHFLSHVSSSSISKHAISDHCLVTFKGNFPASKHLRKSYNWKINNTILDNEHYQLVIRNELLQIFQSNRYGTQNPLQRWLSIKSKLIHLTKQYSRELAQLKREQFDYYHQYLNTLSLQLHTQPALLPDVKHAQAILKLLYARKVYGIQIRSKLHPVPNIHTSLLHIKEEKRHTQTFIHDYHNLHNLSSGGEDIYRAIYNDYRHTFDKRSSPSHPIDFNIFSLPHVPSGLFQQLLQDITPQELEDTLQSLNLEASPGMDGLSVHWYKCFYTELYPYLLAMYNYIFSNPTIPSEFGKIQGILIPKDIHHVSLHTVRFLSIYNVDFKLFTKILVTRLQFDIPHIIHPCQYGIPGADPIHHILGQLRDFIQFQHQRSQSSYALLATDFSRAFDTLKLPYLYQVLLARGFPPLFINILQALYNSRTVILKVNSRNLTGFPMTTGLSQGCPLSSIMFSIAMTPLMYHMQHLLTGLTIRNATLSTISYIDDFSYIIQSPSEARTVIQNLTSYGNISGIRLNLTKSKMLCLDSSMRPLYDPIVNTTDTLRILGIHWKTNLSHTISFNGSKIVGTLTSLLRRYTYSFPTLEGRVYFVNTFIYSQLYFFLQILPFQAKHIALLRKLVGYFLWKHYPLRIAHSVLTNDYSSGGLRLKNFHLQGLALRIHRTLQLVCHYQHSFSYDYLQTILQHIDPVAPLDIQQWRHFNPFFEDVYIHLSYFLIAQTALDTFTTQNIYRYLTHQEDPHVPNIVRHFPRFNWSLIFQNLRSVRQYDLGYDI